jgi:hypothetical protein
LKAIGFAAPWADRAAFEDLESFIDFFLQPASPIRFEVSRFKLLGGTFFSHRLRAKLYHE